MLADVIWVKVEIPWLGTRLLLGIKVFRTIFFSMEMQNAFTAKFTLLLV